MNATNIFQVFPLSLHDALPISQAGHHIVATARTVGGLEELDDKIRGLGGSATLVPLDIKDFDGIARLALDRKSTRLNSSHMSISYAGFCLKKKRNNEYKKDLTS